MTQRLLNLLRWHFERTEEKLKENSTLLVIDDEELILEIIEELLEGIIDNVLTATNGKIGLEILESNPDIDCVICDIQMPVMNGAETIKLARSKGIETPFIFYTAYGDDHTLKEVAKYGIFDFLHKPKFDNLFEVVTKGIEHGIKLKSNEALNESDLQSILDTLGEEE